MRAISRSRQWRNEFRSSAAGYALLWGPRTESAKARQPAVTAIRRGLSSLATGLFRRSTGTGTPAFALPGASHARRPAPFRHAVLSTKRLNRLPKNLVVVFGLGPKARTR